MLSGRLWDRLYLKDIWILLNIFSFSNTIAINRGWFAANVPLIPQVVPPSALLACPSERVFCLTMNPGRLRELRQTRANQTAIPLEPYASPKHISQELQYGERLCLENGWRTIDVTGKSVEEVAREIIALLPKHRRMQ